MPTGQDSYHAPPLGGTLAVVIFALTLIAFVVESQLTQYVQTTLGYRQPFFIFYLVHSSFTVIFPLHILYLTSRSGYTRSALLKGLSLAITEHLSSSETSTSFPYYSFARVSLLLFFGLTCPALLWFAAVSLASLIDAVRLMLNKISAIWNTNAFFAYVFTVKFLHLPWESRRLLAVLLATLGVMVVVYGGSSQPGSSESQDIYHSAQDQHKAFSPFVLYKKYAALPSDPELVSEETVKADIVYPPPFGLHPNLLASFVGLLTITLLWIPLPLLHYSGIERFELPSNLTTTVAIAGIAASGIVFNAGFLVLLGIWGPIITSVGNLLTIVLVTISDIVFGAGIENFTIWSFTAFGVLVYDMYKKGSGIA
ncbi:hypothetical protein F5887DRAFT_943715 [Amanita rubescens]|nr:hypothetical protein F5887DRAFT_943715 [Amanita rubescens]